MQQELKHIINKVDFLYADIKNCASNFNRGLGGISGNSFSSRTKAGGISKYQIESHLKDEVEDYFKEQVLEEIQRLVNSGIDGVIGNTLLVPGGISKPSGVFSISIDPRYEGTIRLVDEQNKIYSYRVRIIVRYDATMSGNIFESISGSFSTDSSGTVTAE